MPQKHPFQADGCARSPVVGTKRHLLCEGP